MRFASCSRFFPPCYSFQSHGYENEEKDFPEKETGAGKIEAGEIQEDR
jgi:hypothetical protein